MIPGLHEVLDAIWQSGTILPDLLKVVVIPLWKAKGNHLDCIDYRGIPLLSISSKALAPGLLIHTRDHLLRHQD